MPTKLLHSKNAYVMRLPQTFVDGKLLPAIDLPKSRYRPGEVYLQGPRMNFQARPYMEVTEEEQQRIAASPQIQGMFAAGLYEYVDHVPESMKTTEDLVAELRAENEELRGKLGMPVHPGSAVPVAAPPANPATLEEEEATSPIAPDAVPEVSLPDPVEEIGPSREEIMKMSYVGLQNLAKERGMENVKVSKSKLFEFLLEPGPSDPESA
jgi:hypothetical protein